jgi:hypothetical protein
MNRLMRQLRDVLKSGEPYRFSKTYCGTGQARG